MKEDVEIRPSGKGGKGLFATREFSAGERILHVDGKVVETGDPRSFPAEVQAHWFPFRKEGGNYWYLLPEAPWKFLNHSCEPNAGIKERRGIVAMRPIRKGEEICIDYAMNNIDGWSMECACGSARCRGTISTFARLDEATQERYREYALEEVEKEREKK